METLRFGFLDLFSREGDPEEFAALVEKTASGLRKREKFKKIDVIDATEGKRPVIMIRNSRIPDMKGDFAIEFYNLGTNMDCGLVHSLNSVYLCGLSARAAEGMKDLSDAFVYGAARRFRENSSTVMMVMSAWRGDKHEKKMIFVHPEDSLEWTVEKDILRRTITNTLARRRFLARMHKISTLLETDEQQILETDIICDADKG